MTNEEKEKYLNIKIDSTTTVREAGAVSFVTWMLKKVDGASTFDKSVAEIRNLSFGYPGRTMSDETKIEWLQKLESIGIPL